jgi:hypothetical protein
MCFTQPTSPDGGSGGEFGVDADAGFRTSSVSCRMVTGRSCTGGSWRWRKWRMRALSFSGSTFCLSSGTPHARSRPRRTAPS